MPKKNRRESASLQSSSIIPLVLSASPSPIKLSESDAIELRRLEEDIVKAQSAFNWRVRQLAKAHNIDPDGTSKWNLDTTTMTFSRVAEAP